jgi:hypothetical protein
MPVKTPSDKSCKVGVLLTLADLYRQSMPGITDQYTRHWRRVLDDLLEGSATLHFAQTAHTGEEVGDAVRSCEQAGCDMLLVLPMAYAPSGAAIEALCETRIWPMCFGGVVGTSCCWRGTTARSVFAAGLNRPAWPRLGLGHSAVLALVVLDLPSPGCWISPIPRLCSRGSSDLKFWRCSRSCSGRRQ